LFSPVFSLLSLLTNFNKVSQASKEVPINVRPFSPSLFSHFFSLRYCPLPPSFHPPFQYASSFSFSSFFLLFQRKALLTCGFRRETTKKEFCFSFLSLYFPVFPSTAASPSSSPRSTSAALVVPPFLYFIRSFVLTVHRSFVAVACSCLHGSSTAPSLFSLHPKVFPQSSNAVESSLFFFCC